MLNTYLDCEPDGELLQRRWFAAVRATRRLEAECRQLLNTLRHADEAWRRACGELEAFEALTDALEEQLTCMDEAPVRRCEPLRLGAVSAA
jgi:hypothetical protein